MDAADLKLEFTKQVKDADEKLAAAEKQLTQLKEYKLKLLGGLETLELLAPKTEEQGGVPELSTVPPVPPEPSFVEPTGENVGVNDFGEPGVNVAPSTES